MLTYFIIWAIVGYILFLFTPSPTTVKGAMLLIVVTGPILWIKTVYKLSIGLFKVTMKHYFK